MLKSIHMVGVTYVKSVNIIYNIKKMDFVKILVILIVLMFRRLANEMFYVKVYIFDGFDETHNISIVSN